MTCSDAGAAWNHLRLLRMSDHSCHLASLSNTPRVGSAVLTLCLTSYLGAGRSGNKAAGRLLRVKYAAGTSACRHLATSPPSHLSSAPHCTPLHWHYCLHLHRPAHGHGGNHHQGRIQSGWKSSTFLKLISKHDFPIKTKTRSGTDAPLIIVSNCGHFYNFQLSINISWFDSFSPSWASLRFRAISIQSIQFELPSWVTS